MKRVFFLFLLSLVLCSQGDAKEYDTIRVHGNHLSWDSIPSWDDPKGGSYTYALPSMITSRVEKYAVDKKGAIRIIVNNFTKAELDTSQGKDRTMSIKDRIPPLSSATGFVYFNDLFHNGAFFYGHYYEIKRDPDQTLKGEMPPYIAIKIWNTHDLKYNMLGEKTGLKTSWRIVKLGMEIAGEIPYVGMVFSWAATIMDHFMTKPDYPPDPNNLVFRINGTPVTAYKKNIDRAPSMTHTRTPEGKDSYDAYALELPAIPYRDKDNVDPAALYMVENIYFRSVATNGMKGRGGHSGFTIPTYMVNVYYKKDYWEAKHRAYKSIYMEREAAAALTPGQKKLFDYIDQVPKGRLGEKLVRLSPEERNHLEDLILPPLDSPLSFSGEDYEKALAMLKDAQ